MSTLLALFESSGIVDTILGVVGTILYPLFSIIFLIIQLMQNLFYSFAGINTANFGGTPIYNENKGMENDTGLLYHLLTRPLVRNMVLSIMILALFLIVIFTVMAFLKNIYSAKPKKWQEIIGSAIKGAAHFILLPVFCLLGVWAGNILLQAINGATSNGGSVAMERKLFIAAAYNANVFRCDEGAAGEATWTSINKLATQSKMLNDSSKSFADAHTIEKHLKAGTEDQLDPAYFEYYANVIDQIYSETNADITWYWNVGEYYSLWNINYIVLVAGGIFMLYALCVLAFGMVRRIFLILMLFMISPGVCALYPLDDGKAVETWKGKVKEQVLSGYGAVAGINLFFSIMPLIEKISIFENIGHMISLL